MAIARLMGQRSLCSRDRVGAIIVDADNRIVDSGYNGPPRGWAPIHSDSCLTWCPRAVPYVDEVVPPRDPHYDDCVSIHAEANALMFSDRTRRIGGTIYVSSGTCGGCAKLVANSGLVRAVYGSSVLHRDSEKWYDFLRECGIAVTLYEPSGREAPLR